MARYSNEFRERAVARLLPPESAEVSRVSQEIGVSVSTLERWRADALSRPARERPWTAAPSLHIHQRRCQILVTESVRQVASNKYQLTL